MTFMKGCNAYSTQQCVEDCSSPRERRFLETHDPCKPFYSASLLFASELTTSCQGPARESALDEGRYHGLGDGAGQPGDGVLGAGALHSVVCFGVLSLLGCLR